MDKHYIVRHSQTLEVVDRGCHDEADHEDIRLAWGAHYELILVPDHFDIAKHCVSTGGETRPRAEIAPTFSRASGRKGETVTMTGLTPGATIKVNARFMKADATGKIEFTSRDGDDFIEAVNDCCGKAVLPDSDRVKRKRTTNAKYLEKNEHAQAFLQ